LRLLLDTHVWIWWHDGSRRLGTRVRRAMERPATELWLSPISVWEAVRLADARRLRLDPDAITWVRDALAALPVREAAVTHEIALRSRRLELAHDDPADRLLVATAQLLGLTLVTADARLLATREVPLLACR
jgi:PIN domain nuclease of toxin-antitoxin system